MTTHIGEYKMDQVTLDLGSDMNVLPKQTWEHMGKPALHWSPIQLRMENQQKIFPMGRLQGVIVDIVCLSFYGRSMRGDFETLGTVTASRGSSWAIS